MEFDGVTIGAVLAVLIVLITILMFRDQIFSDNKDQIPKDLKSRNLVDVYQKLNKKALVIYASQTGTAEGYAIKFAREFEQKFDVPTLAADCDDYDINNLHELPEDVLVFFFVSSFGEGDFADSGQDFSDYLQELEADSLTNLKYTSFGFGNSNYEYFNGAHKKLNKYLSSAGAKKFLPSGEANDGADSTKEDFLAWKADTLEKLEEILK